MRKRQPAICITTFLDYQLELPNWTPLPGYRHGSHPGEGKSDATHSAAPQHMEPARALGTRLQQEGHNLTAARYWLFGKTRRKERPEGT